MEAYDQADGEDDGAEVGNDEVNFVLGTPTVDKETDRTNNARYKHRWHAELG